MSRGTVVAATVSGGDVASVVGSVSLSTDASAASGGAGSTSLAVVDVSVVVRVVATRVSESAMRRARTAEATRADATDDVSMVMGSPELSLGDDGDGENAAKPITATRAMMRRLAYAIGIRGLTCLRGSR